MRATLGDQPDHVGVLAHMMGLSAGEEAARLARVSPEDLQRATFAAVRALIARLVEKGPTVLVLEDLHWADPTSLRLTEDLAPLARDDRLLLLATRRLEPDPGVSAFESSLCSDPALRSRRCYFLPSPPTPKWPWSAHWLGSVPLRPSSRPCERAPTGTPCSWRSALPRCWRPAPSSKTRRAGVSNRA